MSTILSPMEIKFMFGVQIFNNNPCFVHVAVGHDALVFTPLADGWDYPWMNPNAN